MIEHAGKNRWINVVLFFSLALNFFIAGYLVSDIRVFKGMHVKKIIHKRPEIRIVDYFPRAERKKFRQMMSEQREKIKPVKRGVFESQKEIFIVLSERDIDELKLRQAFQKYQNNNDHLQTTLNNIMVDMIMKMDHQTRLRIIERGKRAHENRKKMRENLREKGGHLIKRLEPPSSRKQ